MQRFELDAVDSTNLEAKRLLATGRITGPAIVTAREQTAGRGSRGRSWLSPRDAGIYLTVIDLPTLPMIASSLDPTMFTLAAGTACVEVLREHAGVGVGIKPVNDLCVDGRKLGGILTEAVVERQTVRALITGIGINVRAANRPVSRDAAEPVALQSLMPAQTFAHLDLISIVDRLAERVLDGNRRVWSGDVEGVRAAWREYVLSDGTSTDLAVSPMTND